MINNRYSAALALIRCLFTTTYIDSVLFSSALKLLAKYYKFASLDICCKDIELLNKTLKVKLKWNLLISIHPTFWEKYNKSLAYLNRIKESMRDDDTISLYTYSESKLKRGMHRRKANNINFEDNFDTYDSTDALLPNKDSINFIQRLYNYNKTDHIVHMCDFKHKNLFISFTSQKEWENSRIDAEVEEFLDYLRVAKQSDNSIMLIFIIIVFPDCDISDYIEEIGITRNDQMESFIKFTKECSTLNRLKDMISTKKYPITLIDTTEKVISLDGAVDYVAQLLKFSNSDQVKYCLQNLIN